MKRRLGLLGGTFDPVHNGHLLLAQAALNECGLDGVYFIPAAHPPHKDGNTITTFSHRLAMLRLACSTCSCSSQLAVSDVEQKLTPPSYSVNMLGEIRRTLFPHDQLYFIIGSDAFLDILSWKAYSEVLSGVGFILGQRQGDMHSAISGFLEALGYCPTGKLDGQNGQRWVARLSESAVAGKRQDIFMLQSAVPGISSSEVRDRLYEGKDVSGQLPKAVYEYLQREGLYKRVTNVSKV